MARERLTALRYPKDVIDSVARLVFLHLRFHGYGEGEAGWTDSAVRRYVRDAGDLLGELNELTRSDCTTRNERKARQLAQRMDALEARIERLQAEEELAGIRPDLDGNQVMDPARDAARTRSSARPSAFARDAPRRGPTGRGGLPPPRCLVGRAQGRLAVTTGDVVPGGMGWVVHR